MSDLLVIEVRADEAREIPHILGVRWTVGGQTSNWDCVTEPMPELYRLAMLAPATVIECEDPDRVRKLMLVSGSVIERDAARQAKRWRAVKAVARPTLITDTEVYRDYFLASFMNEASGNVYAFEMFDGQPLDREKVSRVLRDYRIVTFNGNGYDLPILSAAVAGYSCAKLKELSDRIILNNAKPWQLGIEVSKKIDHIDLIEVAPGIASLKIYGGRMHSRRMQDLPIEPDASIAPEQRAQLRDYCANDLGTTRELFRSLLPQIELRERMSREYGFDLRSKSDAQIAEAVIKHGVEQRSGAKLEKRDPFRLAGRTFKFEPPDFLKAYAAEHAFGAFRDAFVAVCKAEFSIAGNGTVQMPKEIANLKTAIGRSVYRMGIGGLHSSETSAAHTEGDGEYLIVDRDVTSYYPSIILRCGLRPASMGEHFTAVYRDLVAKRIAAKVAGDKVTADSLKITINGSFGKFGSPYSALYSPTLLIQTTVTGQLSLLMLIDALEFEGIPVVSANTDGVVIKCPRDRVALMDYIVWEWEARTGFETEATHYRALYSRDVNNYVAIKDGAVKVKGVYAPSGLSKNPTNEIVATAVVKFLQDGTPVETTIRECRDIRRFVSVRSVKGGAVKGDAYLGKAVRWYYAQGETGAIHYRVNGYLVPRTEGARPLMDLPETFPSDVNFDWYIREACSTLADLGVPVAQPAAPADLVSDLI